MSVAQVDKAIAAYLAKAHVEDGRPRRLEEVRSTADNVYSRLACPPQDHSSEHGAMEVEDDALPGAKRVDESLSESESNEFSEFEGCSDVDDKDEDGEEEEGEEGQDESSPSSSEKNTDAEGSNASDSFRPHIVLPNNPKFPKSVVTFTDNGEQIVQLSINASQRMAVRVNPEKATDVFWMREVIVFFCSAEADGQAPIQTFINSVRFANRLVDILNTKEFALCKCMIDIAKAWATIGTAVRNREPAYMDLIKEDSDIEILRKDKKKRKDEALCLGWLTLQTYPELEKNRKLDQVAFSKFRDRLKNDIAAGEHLSRFEDVFGDAIFLLFVPGWKRVFRNGRYELTQDFIDGFVLRRCPALPDLIRALDPISAHVIKPTASVLPTFAFEAEGALRRNSLMLESLLRITNSQSIAGHLAIEEVGSDAESDGDGSEEE
ncbi:hypothetical protein BKA80DRAFT_306232 [Phyllosticta citrichinensis]